MAEVPNNERLVTDINTELESFLSPNDKELDSQEAKQLWDKYNQGKTELEAGNMTTHNWIIDVSKDNLRNLREALWVEDLSIDELWYVTWNEWNKISDIANNQENIWDPYIDNLQESFQDSKVQEVLPSILDNSELDDLSNEKEWIIDSTQEIEVLINESPSADFDIYLWSIWNKLNELGLDASKDILVQIMGRSELVTQIQFNIKDQMSEEQQEEFSVDGKAWDQTKRAIQKIIDEDSNINSIEEMLLSYDIILPGYVENKESQEIFWSLTSEQKQYLQAVVKALPDGIIWNGSKEKLDAFLKKNHLDLPTLIEKYKINEFHLDYDYDEPLAEVSTMEQAKENFVNSKYNIIRSELESYLGLPTDFSLAIIQKESAFFTALNSGTWSKWWMQLTASPFEDMKWDGAKWKNPQSTLDIRNNDIARYQELFSKIIFSEFKNISLWENEVIWDTLPDDIWLKLESISTASPDKAIVLISQLQTIIKAWSNNEKYLHTLNMIFWSVYLSGKYNRTSGTEKERVYKAAVNYNGDTKISTKNWVTKEERYHYADRVVKNWENTNN